MEKKKIYFAGSIRGGRDDVETYHAIINYLLKSVNVLTEHIGDKQIGPDGENNVTDEYIYQRDCKWIEEADMVIAEVTNPSLGVGYEIGYAESLGKPVVCLYRNASKKRLSAMLSGNNKVQIIVYNDVLELYDSLDIVIEKLNNEQIRCM